ncbi:hypothetical protein [Streptomyces sp. NBC_01465]|uniref:hypothetical protein n=1 Tax=Streptomyces sp. NBC_01465 TaxID=2903878 RepID=UPI002E37DE9C|nr:hypothetical protein [Streptomyces sp. NBC_01465]
MFEYEIQKLRAADLMEQAHHHRLVNEIRKARRDARRADRRVSALRARFVRAA